MIFGKMRINTKLAIACVLFAALLGAAVFVIVPAGDDLVRFLALAVPVSLVAFGMVIAAASAVSGSARRLQDFFSRLADKDLSGDFVSGDEFGQAMGAFNRFLEKLRPAFHSFSENAERISTAVYDLSASAKQISATAAEQSSSVAEIVSTMEGNKNLSVQAAAKTAEVAELAVKTQELSKRGADLRDANQDMMQDIREQNSRIIDEIKNLADMLGRIDETVTIIDAIADQTKLIAFNAALEASSSGEAGARFAVVAGEIRRFAGNVVESTAEIKERISEVQAASRTLIEEANNGSRKIDSGYERMVEQKSVFENIVDISQNVAIRSQQISNLSKQQEFASSQIFQALKEISAGVQQFVSATASTSKIADTLNGMSAQLRQTAASYRTENTRKAQKEK
ncbi:MAG: methyl-accepting chemotaxis protein [Spirochaetales bacterium]|jgi:methyl-accepting chemotaxis protein|nr:methyl-accepting chemotaxis protein [Spirochaetales bacterium]